MIEVIIAALTIAVASVSGVFFFGDHRRLIGLQRFVVPVAVGVFLSLVLYELIPETLAAAPEWGGIVVAFGFVGFYVLAHVLHKRYHHLEADDCDRKGAAALLLIGDAIHNVTDGVVLAGAFLIDPAVGVATTIALLLHEVPQEIVEFGVLVRAGYARTQAVLYNLLSASSILIGVVLYYAFATFASDFIWVLTGIAAGNLLFLAASDLLPRIHGNLKNYGSIWYSTLSIVIGFALMTAVLYWSHELIAHDHDEVHTGEVTEDAHDH